MTAREGGIQPDLPKWEGGLIGVLSTNVIIVESSYYEISNDSGGKTVYIGGGSNGDK